jgi:hypothetical protein
MRASARIVAEADRSGGTRLAVLRGESPLLFRRTGPRKPPAGAGSPSRPSTAARGRRPPAQASPCI